jgi:hypothetical protein
MDGFFIKLSNMNNLGKNAVIFKIAILLFTFCTIKVCRAQSYYPGGLAKSKFIFWLDANDTTTITKSSGTVTRWTDKVNGLQAISPSTGNNPLVNSSILSGKYLIEFQGAKVLNIADNPLLDPTNGFNVAQIVYVHPDASTNYTAATDFRVGPFSRNENPNGINIGTSSITLKYVTADSKYRLSLQKNTSSVVLGNGNTSFADLSGTWNLLENYLTWTNATDTAIVVQQNASAQISSPYNWYNSSNSLGIGNRPVSPASIHWSIGETVFAGVPLRNAGKNILDIYLANKWGLQTNLPSNIQNLYNSPSSSFNNNIVGIGNEGGVDSINTTGSNNGLGFANVVGINGFLRESGDYLLAGDNASSGTSAFGTNFTRWNRIWFIDKTDNVGYGGNVNIFFDFTSYGIGNSLDTANYAYYLLYNSSSSNFNSGTNYVIPVSSYAQLSGTKQLAFLTDAININNGYYTIIYAPKNTPISNIPLLGTFTSPVVSISPGPYISNSYAGNTFNYLSINTDSIKYSIAYFKIYVSINSAAPILLDSISSSSKFYAHYNINNGSNYAYYIKAGYSDTKESSASNTVTLTPGIYSPIWQTQPQYAGSGKIFMAAISPMSGAPVKYYFQAVSGGGHSYGYTATNNYTDSLLANGNTYTYQYKIIDTIKGATTESSWSAPVSILLADSAKGGFAYKFSFADNSSYIIPNGTGPTNYIATSIDTTGLRFIKHAPAAYVHPRIYCNPEDSTDIRWRLKNTNSGRAVAKYIHTLTTLLQLGYSPGTYSSSANYAKDTLGNPLLSNIGYYNEKPRYDSLAAGDIGVVQNIASGFSGYADQLANVLAYEAFECWLYKGKIDSTTMTSYTTRANRLASAVSLWAKKALTVNNPNVSFTNRDNFGSLQIAFIYDFLYDQMTPTQRDTVRMFIAALQPTDSTQLHLYNTPSYATVTNWSTFGWEIWNILAIEGETGYTQTDENTLQNYCRTVLNFLNYGFYSQTGGPIEGIGKNQLNVPMLVALAKRGYSLLSHPAVRAFATKYYPAIMQPFGYSMLGTDLLGGTGKLNDFVFNTYISAAYGGWKHATSLDPIGLKWAFPNDTTIDFVWKNYMQKTVAGGATYNYNYRYQDFLGDSKGHAGYWNFLHAAIFASGYSNTPLQTLAQKVYSNNLMYFDSLGGFATLRSSYDSSASALFFHCRTDLGGHTYGNKNDVVYSSLGRIWIPRVTSNANSDAPQASGTGVASSILINNIGQSVDTTDAQNLNILPIPGKIMAYQNSPSVQMIAGDASEAYSYQWSYLFGGYTGDNPLLGGVYTKVLKTLNSYRYGKYYIFDDIPLYNKYTQGDYSWLAGPRYYRTVASPWLNGIITKAYRTVAMVTDAKPYVLVTDDVQKDGTVSNYKWVAQLANDLTIDSVVVNNNNTSFRNDIIFKEPSATGNRRFLVRVLNNNGAINTNVPVYIDSVINPIGSVTPNDKLPRMVIESNSIDPKYKVLLFTYHQGDLLPKTIWNSDHSRLLVTTSASTNTILFPVDSIGRTNIQVISGNTSFTENVWLGTNSTDWADTANWSKGVLPSTNDTVIISGLITNQPIIANAITANVAKIKLTNKGNLNVAGIINVLDSITISDSCKLIINTTGALVGNCQVVGNVTLQQNIIAQRGYRIFANPFSTTLQLSTVATTNGITINTTPSLSGLTDARIYNNNNNNWSNAGATISANTPYALFIRGLSNEVNGLNYTNGPSAFTYSVTGSLNSLKSSFFIPTPTNSNNFSIIGNPFPAPVSSIALTGGNVVPYYVYKISRAGNGRTIAGSWQAQLGSSNSTTIPALGIVAWKQPNTSYSIPASAINTSGSLLTGLFGDSDTTSNYIALQIEKDSTLQDIMFVRYSKNALSTGGDNFDLVKFYNDNTNLYSITPDKIRLAIDARNQLNETIPIGISALKGNYILRVSSNTLPFETKVLLKDKYLNIDTLLNNQDAYSFQIGDDSTSKGENRFELSFLQKKVVSNDTLNTDFFTAKVSPSVTNSYVNVSIVGGNNSQVTIKVLSIDGKILDVINAKSGDNRINLIGQSGIIILHISNSKQSRIFKVTKQ